MDMSIIYILNLTFHAFLVGSLLLGFHRKLIARIQGRPGPPVIQYLLHTIKFYFKEITFPITAGNPLYIFIPLFDLSIWLIALIIAVVLKSSLLILIGIYILQKIVEHGCGLSSGSPYGKMGGVRSVFSAAAEVPLFSAVAVVYLAVKSTLISDIIAYQQTNGALIFKLPIAAFAFFILLASKSPYSPFGIVKGKDIVSGYMTEHYGLLASIIYIAESISYYVLLWLFITVFLGITGIIPTLAAMVVLTIILSFISALTPLLAPHHSVMLQMSIAGLVLIDVIYRLLAY
ncbi:respiratory-chain NADH dehydrogenase subunit 1 [Methanocaldococcus villosus KIN24-T80]|uniref:Respiratory-chain NADH dehydrogenase subunit 1 n=1 Tax=Methanocaldococcus villosus KIN24-T80 TaxID=1069083 RepID=N6W077_9EURY|nr:NADH-quinone oxidoreductase subunit H [Methanocaldococcus villosus]ENN96767.1 respiratory-chain NADH dehydrogenase subunit 1 [Methanocaldococcus villosus KIN24-T80]